MVVIEFIKLKKTTTMKTSPEKATDEKKKDEQIKAILFLLETHLQDQLDEVQKSNALIELGAKTALIKELEKDIEDPFQNVMNVALSVNRTALSLLHHVFKSHLLKNANLVVEAYLVPLNALMLDYYLILADETEATWDQVHSFLVKYHQSDLADVYAVRFNVIQEIEIALLPANKISIL